MSRVLAFAAALAVCGSFTGRLSAQESRPAAGGGLSGLRARVAAVPEAEKAKLTPEAAPAESRPKTVFQAAQARGLAPQAVPEVDYEAILRQPARFEFVDTPLSDAIAYLANQHNIEIQLDRKGLADAAVDPSAPVTASLRKPIALESALHLILDEFDLTFTVQDEVMKITSKEKADEVLITVVYPVSDLLSRQRNWGPLMNMITNTVQPDSWDDNGGPGSMQPFTKGGLLIISQKRDVHAEIRELLANMRLELAKVKLPPADPQQVTTVVYQLSGASGEQTAEAIRKLVMPKAWQGLGGEGEVCVITRKTANNQAADLLMVRQTEEIHGQIQDLLAEFQQGVVGGMGRGMMGGMGGGMGGMVGGMGGGFIVTAAPAEAPAESAAPAEAEKPATPK